MIPIESEQDMNASSLTGAKVRTTAKIFALVLTVVLLVAGYRQAHEFLNMNPSGSIDIVQHAPTN